MNKPRNITDLGIRPLSARSVVLSVLLGSHPPELPIAALVALADRFGIAAGTVRTAVSRMVAAGELTATDGGYRLSGRLLDRQREQDIGRTAADQPWDGSWWVVTALTARRSVSHRRHFRSVVEGAKLGELRPDTWMRPANLPVDIDIDGLVVSAGTLPTEGSLELVDRLWDLSALSARGQLLSRALDHISSDLGDENRGEPIASGFTVLAACLRFLRVEPQLPRELIGPSPADELRARYSAVEAMLQQQLQPIFRAAVDARQPSPA